MSEAFVYLWYDSENKMFYLGKHKGTPEDRYTHSSTIWESFTKDNIPKGTKRRILAFGTNKEMCELEHKLLKDRKSRCWDRYYNESLGDPRYVDTSGKNNPRYKHGLTIGEKIVEYRKQYRKDNKEKIAERMKQWRKNNKEYKKQYRKDNKEKIAELGKQYYENNKEKIAERMKQYRKDNKEKIAANRKNNKEYMKQYRKDNKEKIVEYRKQYRKNNKEKIAEYDRQYQKNNKEKIAERDKQYYKDNKEKILERMKQYKEKQRYQETR
jgi:hypothetical protein